MANSRFFSSCSAPKNASGLSFFRAGGVCGNVKQNRPRMTERIAASHMPSKPPRPPNKPGTHSRNATPSSKPTVIQPIVPQTRTRPNSPSAAGMWWKQMELVSASVGPYSTAQRPIQIQTPS